MKFQLCAFLAVLSTGTSFSQTNALPNSGNVGIGTTAPQTLLHMKGAGESTLLLDETGGVKYSISSRWGGYFTIWDETNPQFAGRPRFAINPGSGDVGIGTVFPTAGLEISRASMAQAPSLALSVGPGASSVGDGPSLSFLHSGNERGYRIYERAIATHRGELRFASGNSSTGYDDRVVFDINGNVGIGTNSPGAKLDVAGAIRSLGSGFQAWGSGQLQLQFLNQGDATDQRITELIQQGGTFTGRFVNDAYGAAQDWLSVKRNAGTYTVQNVTFPSGNVGIGTTNPTHKLAVNGTIKAKEVIVETTGWSDYVFADDYRLAPLAEVEAHIKTNKHLPGLPSAAQVADQGVSLGDMQARLLAKIEELTLHVISQEKRLASLEAENTRLRATR